MRQMSDGALAGLSNTEDVVPVSHLKRLKAKLWELERTG
jgi:hypothetical protein